jgi:hypothetical protein
VFLTQLPGHTSRQRFKHFLRLCIMHSSSWAGQGEIRNPEMISGFRVSLTLDPETPSSQAHMTYGTSIRWPIGDQNSYEPDRRGRIIHGDRGS